MPSGGDIFLHVEEQQTSFLSTSNTTWAQANSTQVTMLNSIYGRPSLLLVRAHAIAFMAHSNTTTTMDLLGGYG